jgi:anti-sigma B factor antagonist
MTTYGEASMIELKTKSELFGDGTYVVSVTGELDLYSAPQLHSELTSLQPRQVRSVIVDLTECQFIDSTALGVLVKANKRLSTANVRLSLVTTDRKYPKDLRDHRVRPHVDDPSIACDRHERRSKPCLVGRTVRRPGAGS